MADRSVVVRLRAEIAGYRAAMSQAATATRNAAREMSREMATSARDNEQAWNRAGTALTAFGAVAVGGLGVAVKAAIDWETAWTGVLKTVDGTPAQLAKVEEGLRGLARELPISHAELAGVAEAAGQLGIATDDVVGFTKVMVDLGQTTNLTSEEAATSLARISNIMGTSAKDVDRMGATIVELGNNSATTEAEIVAMSTRLAAAGKQAGLSESDIFAFASTLTSVGVEAEAGGTAVSKVFTSIADATKDGGDKLDTFARVAGMSAGQFKAAFENDAAGGVAAFIEGMGRMANAGESTTQVFEDLELNDARLKRSVLSTGAASGLLTEQLGMANAAWEANTALVEEAEKRYSTTASQIASAKGSIEDAAITMGQTFLPVIADMAQGISKTVDAFGALPPSMQAVIGVTTLLVGGTALLSGGFLLLAPRIVETRAAFATLATSMTRTTAAARFAAAAVAGVSAAALSTIAATIAAGKAVDALISDDSVPKANRLAAAIKDIGLNGKEIGDVGGQFANFGNILGIQSGAVEGLKGSFDALLAPSNMQKFQGFVGNIPGLTSNIERAEERVKGLDVALVSMIESGDTDAVAGFQAGLLDMGYSAEQVNKMLPATAEALLAVEAAAVSSSPATVRVADSFGRVTEMSAEAAEAMQEWREKVMETSSAFINPAGAYQAAIDASMAWAQAQADATESAEDSWEDFYDGQSVSMSQMLAEQQAQLDAQVNYNANMISLAGQVSSGYLTYLQSLGTEAAPMIAELANALPEELAASDAMYLQGVSNANEYADGLQAIIDGREVTATIQADGSLVYTVAEQAIADVDAMGPAAWDLTANQDPAIETAANSAIPLLSGMTVDPWDLSVRPENALQNGQSTSDTVGRMTPAPWDVDANADPARAEANRAKNEIDAKNATIKVGATEAPGLWGSVQNFVDRISSRTATIRVAAGQGGAGGITSANGNIIDYYADGGLRENHVAQIAPAGSWRVWAEPETGGEAYIPLAESKRPRSIDIWRETGKRLGQDVQQFADGGIIGLWRQRLKTARYWVGQAKGWGDDAAVKRAEERVREAEAAIKSLQAERETLKRSTRRGQVTDQATSGLSGAYSVINDLWDNAKDTRFTSSQRANLWQTAAKAEPAMKRLYGQAEKLEKSLGAARDRAKELGSISDGVASRLSSEFSLEGATKQNTNSRGDIWYTTGSIGANAKATAARVKGFAEKLSRLQKMGLSGGVLQELAQMGSVEGSAAADALLAGGKGEIGTVNKAFSDIAKWSGQAGQYVTEGFYKGGLEAANGIVKGLESQQGAIEEQILKIAKGMEKALKSALGIKSPSRVTTAIGAFTGEGLIVGMKGKRRAIEDEATAMGLAAIPGVPSGASSASLSAASSRYTPVVNVNAPAPSLDGLAVTGQFSVGPDGLLTLVDGRIRQAESATATSVSRRY